MSSTKPMVTSDPANAALYRARPDMAGLLFVSASDAHRLGDVEDAAYEFDAGPIDDTRTRARARQVRAALLSLLRHGTPGRGI